MAISLNGGSAFRRSRFRTQGALSEMNVVPLVDVVLVLLIIFMLTAHVMEFGLEVDVPKVRQTRDSAEELPVVTVTQNGNLYLNDKLMNINDLGAAIRQQFPGMNAVYVRADRGAVWDPIAQVISELGLAKLEVRVVTQPDEESGNRRK
ncbi:MAG: biopolymer transporter ExbD [Bryobacteraceae bacterium]|nr:biopolymer transporter ExbD [Bryobacterales bacterium]MEB2360911.1 biopolymer transporter ExbD [Bryobacterales bacterium]NUN00344.1 biopolymer transporter ExbD [Bryobacteraceae bacterium]